MINILLIEDDMRDAGRIISLLNSSLAGKYDYSLLHKSGTNEALACIEESAPDLILMDLEIKNENQTTLGMLNRIPRTIPIIVISHLSHYQKPSLRHGNVIDFVSKSNLDDRLVDRVRQALSPRNASEPDSVLFPAAARDDISESVPIRKISYIILTGRGRYDIHLTDGKILSLRSVLFRDLKRVLKEQNITSLRPVSRNEIININYISKITKSPNGRLSVTVIGNDLSPFHIGTGYEKFFADEFL